MSKIEDGGAAFPIPNDPRPGAYEAAPGMSLRDYFAAVALIGIGTWTPDPDFSLGEGPISYEMPSVVKRRARWAYAQADAMIAASKGATDV